MLLTPFRSWGNWGQRAKVRYPEYDGCELVPLIPLVKSFPAGLSTCLPNECSPGKTGPLSPSLLEGRGTFSQGAIWAGGWTSHLWFLLEFTLTMIVLEGNGYSQPELGARGYFGRRQGGGIWSIPSGRLGGTALINHLCSFREAGSCLSWGLWLSASVLQTYHGLLVLMDFWKIFKWTN